MNITEIRAKLVNDPVEKLRAFCSITIDGDFVIRDLKIIDGPNGPFLAMPSRKLADRCLQCGGKNHLRAKFCNECGARLPDNRAPKDAQGRARLHADVAHPINAACRERIQKAVVEAFLTEVERSRQPGYEPISYDDDFTDGEADQFEAGRGAGPVADTLGERAEDEDLEESAESSDYNALIAELKRDAAQRREGPPHGREDRPRDRQEKSPSAAQADRGQRDHRRDQGEVRTGRSRRRRRSRDREGTDRYAGPVQNLAPPPPLPAEASAAREAQPKPAVDERPQTAKQEPVSPAAERPETDPLADFGAGIL